MKFKSSWVVAFAGAAALGALVAYRWVHPCAQCPISAVIGALSGPSGCAATPSQDSGAAANPAAAKESTSQKVPPAAAPSDQPTMSTATKVKTETAMFGGGCFWGVEATFRKAPGVVGTEVGYAGGHTKNATYKEVCTDTTGHAEVVRIDFDPATISYQQLVEMFFKLHNPTQVNRQGPDYGTQYRSVIFYYTPEQQKVAEAVKEHVAASGKYKNPIATEIVKAGEFWRAEDYHQRYLEKNGLDNCHLPTDD